MLPMIGKPFGDGRSVSCRSRVPSVRFVLPLAVVLMEGLRNGLRWARWGAVALAAGEPHTTQAALRRACGAHVLLRSMSGRHCMRFARVCAPTRNGASRSECHTLKHASYARIEANPAAALAYREQNVHDRCTCG